VSTKTSLTEADEHFSIAISTIMSMAQNAYQIFKSSRVEAKRAILNILLSNLQIKNKQISYNLRKPFDLIDSLNEKTPPKIGGVAIGDPNEIDLMSFGRTDAHSLRLPAFFHPPFACSRTLFTSLNLI